MQGREPRQPKVGIHQLRAGLVRADVSRQHQNVGAAGRLWHEVRVDFQVQVRQELDFHRVIDLHGVRLCRAADRLTQPAVGTGLFMAVMPQRVHLYRRHRERQGAQHQRIGDAGHTDKMAR